MNNKIDKFFDYLFVILITIAINQMIIYGQINRSIEKIINDKNKIELWEK